MQLDNRQFAEAFHPGVFLEEELEERGWSQIDLAEVLGRPPRLISEIISGKRSITPETAIGLSKALGISAQAWMNLEAAYQLAQAEHKESDITLKAKLYEKFPVREMVKRGWVEATSDISLLVERFCNFFEIPSLEADPEFNYAGRMSGEYQSSLSPVQNAWMFRARHFARAIQVDNTFSQARLKTCLNKLKLLLHESAEIRHIPKILAEAGIRFVIVEAMPGSKIDGATFWLDDEPVIAMSLLRDRIDNFWFTLIHELSHVEHGEGKETAIIDIDLMSADTGTANRPPFELRADKDAAEFCIPADTLQSFILRTDPYFLEAKILGFAALNKVHAGIVVGQLQHRGRVPYRNHRKFLVKVREIITEPAFTDGYGYTL
jgi:HTH-type transcriptional regulator/antitoxin HigA